MESYCKFYFFVSIAAPTVCGCCVLVGGRLDIFYVRFFFQVFFETIKLVVAGGLARNSNGLAFLKMKTFKLYSGIVSTRPASSSVLVALTA